jgi:hypothetical protein
MEAYLFSDLVIWRFVIEEQQPAITFLSERPVLPEDT